MTTARDIIRSALEELGEYSPGEPLDSADADRGLKVLNDMLGLWSNEDLACFAFQTVTFPTVSNQQAYTIGSSGANITSARPLKIEDPAWRILSDGSKSLISVVGSDYWTQIAQPTLAGEPIVLRYDAQAPLGIIRLWPKPDAVWTVGFLTHLQFTAFASLTTDVELPLGYVGALKKNLAVELAPFFNRNPLPITVALAAEYKGRLKEKNEEAWILSMDSRLPGSHTRGDILSGDYA